MGAFNRRRLARILRLPENASDARLARAIRRQARQFRRMGRPFVLPRTLDLDGCFAALDRRQQEEEALLEALSDELDAAIEKARKRYDEKERRVWLRLMSVQLIRNARDRTD